MFPSGVLVSGLVELRERFQELKNVRFAPFSSSLPKLTSETRELLDAKMLHVRYFVFLTFARSLQYDFVKRTTYTTITAYCSD
jgi:hypothetical protein